MDSTFQHFNAFITEIVAAMFFELESKQMSQFLFLLLPNNVKSNLIEVRIQGRS